MSERLLCRPLKAKEQTAVAPLKNNEDIFGEMTPKEVNDVEVVEEKEEKNDLPRWVTAPIVTLALKEYKNGSLMSVIKLGDKSRYIIGREPEWVDVLMHHPSISRRQACIVHGTPPGTPEHYAKSATLLDLGPGSTYYKKSRFAEKKHRIKKGKGVVLRKNMCFIFAKSTRIYEVIGLSVKGSRVAKTNASDIQTKDKVANASVTRKLATLKPELAEKMKRTGETAFSNQFGRHSEFHHNKKRRVESTAKTAAMLEQKQNVAESIEASRQKSSSSSSSSSS